MINLRDLDEGGAAVRIKDAKSLTPYEYGVEYGSPARGMWNIVHTGMLVPESHQIFVCAQGCLRGVVLTAAEMNAMDRFSTVAVCENNVLDGDMESLIIDGVTDILGKLPHLPRAVLVFTSCIHKFMACDLNFVYGKLRERFPTVDFTDCYMTPIMRKTWISPDSKMREQLYSLLKPANRDPVSMNIIGNNYPTDKSADFVQMLNRAGWQVRDICAAANYDEYQKMAASTFNIIYNPAAKAAAESLKSRLGQDYLYLPLSYDYEEIEGNLDKLSAFLSLPPVNTALLIDKAEEELRKTALLLGDTPVAIDYTATSRPLGLAKLLITHGMNVVSVYNDVFSAEEQTVFDWLKANRGDLMLYATVHPKMGMLQRKEEGTGRGEVLAIGQKAAYFTATKHFVNILEGGGMYGFDGICRLSALIRAAALNEKDTEKIIQVKGWGCCC